MAAKRPAAKKPRRSCLARLLLFVVVLAMFGVLAGVAGVAGLVRYYGQELPDIHGVRDYQPRQVSRIVDVDGNVLATLTDSAAEVRTVIPFEQIPQAMRDAMIAAEDAQFYQHRGINFVGIAKAMYRNLRRGQLSQGASTITQQLVKNLVLSPERTIRRKIQEAILAFELEDNLTKDEILTIYLNEVFFGSRAYGVEEASRYYFGHGAAELNLPEAATLAGLVQSPNRYNPHFHPDEALGRRAYVLRQLWEKGFIEEAVYREADAAPLVLDPNRGVGPWEGRFPSYVDAATRELRERFDDATIYSGGLHIVVAVDRDAQAIAEEAVQAGLRDYDGRHGYLRPFRELASDADVEEWRRDHDADVATLGLQHGREYRAVVLTSDEAHTVVGIGPYVATLSREPGSRLCPTGEQWAEVFAPRDVFTVTPAAVVPPASLSESDPTTATVQLLPSAEAALVAISVSDRRVVALVGGYASAGGFNRAVQARRQVGSAFKPVVYGAALARRTITPATILLDQPVTFPIPGQPTWQPQNYDGRYLGPLSIREALARSRNVAAVRVLDLVGLNAATEFARALGVTADLPTNLTLALGSAEMPPFELTNAYATLATGGWRADASTLLRVTDTTGAVLLAVEPELEQTVDAAVAWLTTSLMRSVVTSGTGSAARRVGAEVAAKTGTTNGARDAWFVGFSTELATGVWVGRDDNGELGRGETGGHSAAPIWVDFMTRYIELHAAPPFPGPPPGIVSATIDPSTGLLARPGSAGGVSEFFLDGTAPTELAPDPTERSVDSILLGTGGGVPPAQPSDEDGF
ncbi:MAG: PBP1A family penicillin-binding protein [Myxococcales bacterium]|nr:PBP1A family penicillin-binding protein [Myxococcales bacterium]